jgi:hypothetical protein
MAANISSYTTLTDAEATVYALHCLGASVELIAGVADLYVDAVERHLGRIQSVVGGFLTTNIDTAGGGSEESDDVDTQEIEYTNVLIYSATYFTATDDVSTTPLRLYITDYPSSSPYEPTDVYYLEYNPATTEQVYVHCEIVRSSFDESDTDNPPGISTRNTELRKHGVETTFTPYEDPVRIAFDEIQGGTEGAARAYDRLNRLPQFDYEFDGFVTEMIRLGEKHTGQLLGTDPELHAKDLPADFSRGNILTLLYCSHRLSDHVVADYLNIDRAQAERLSERIEALNEECDTYFNIEKIMQYRVLQALADVADSWRPFAEYLLEQEADLIEHTIQSDSKDTYLSEFAKETDLIEVD